MLYCVDTSAWLDGWQRHYLELLKDFPRLVDTLRNRSKADPFVIATAMDRSAALVTGEILTGRLEKPRIPDVCQAKGLPWMSFLQMIRDLQLTF